MHVECEDNKRTFAKRTWSLLRKVITIAGAIEKSVQIGRMTGQEAVKITPFWDCQSIWMYVHKYT